MKSWWRWSTAGNLVVKVSSYKAAKLIGEWMCSTDKPSHWNQCKTWAGSWILSLFHRCVTITSKCTENWNRLVLAILWLIIYRHTHTHTHIYYIMIIIWSLFIKLTVLHGLLWVSVSQRIWEIKDEKISCSKNVAKSCRNTDFYSSEMLSYSALLGFLFLWSLLQITFFIYVEIT